MASGEFPGALRTVLTRASRKALDRSATLVVAKAKILAAKDSGEMAASIMYTVTGATPETMKADIVVKARQGIFVEKGTGIYGPTGRVIKPKRANVMVFPGKAGVVFAKTVKGQKAQPFLSKALRGIKH